MPRIAAVLITAALGSLLAASAGATPLQYDFVRGSASVRLVQQQTVLATDSADLTGTFATFDDAVPALTDFEWVVDDGSIVLGPLGTIDAQLTATPALGFSAPATVAGVDVWNWSGGPVSVVGSLSFTGGLLDGQTVPVNILLPEIHGTFRTATVDDDTFSLTNAINVYQFDLEGQHYILQLGVAFKGLAVPEPSTAVLVAMGLVIAARRRRA